MATLRVRKSETCNGHDQAPTGYAEAKAAVRTEDVKPRNAAHPVR